MNKDCSTHLKGTNRKRARCSCFHCFAVVIRDLISCPQRCPKSSACATFSSSSFAKHISPHFGDKYLCPRTHVIIRTKDHHMSIIDRVKAVLANKQRNKRSAERLEKAEITLSKQCYNEVQSQSESLTNVAEVLCINIHGLIVPTK